jgi:hypothetical protein
MPTDDQLREYIEQLPPIYRDILTAYPAINPERKVGGSLMAMSLVDRLGPDIDDRRDPGFTAEYDEDEVLDALYQLEARDFLTRHPTLGAISFSPTPLGERLVTLLTGHTPRPKGAPPLPQPAWA